jgi:hypothetical protein
MKESLYFKQFVIVLMLSGLIACSPGEDAESDSVFESRYNATNSMNPGLNCQNCHVSGGNGPHIFTVAGTVYDSNLIQVYPNTTIRLYTQPNGQGNLVATIEVDGLGNFYTTRSVDFGSGLYPSVSSGNGADTEYMSSSTTRGDCNGCHNNNTQSRIFAN